MSDQSPYEKAYTSLLFATSNAAQQMGQYISQASQMYGEAGEDALKFINQHFSAGQSYLTPFRLAGEQSIGTLQNLLGVNGAKKQTAAINNIITPALTAMQSFGQQTANQAMSQFLGVVAPGYNLNANAGAIAQANAANPPTIPGVSSDIAKMSQQEAIDSLKELNAKFKYNASNGINNYDTDAEIKQLKARLGQGFFDGSQYHDFVKNPDGTVMNQSQLEEATKQYRGALSDQINSVRNQYGQDSQQFRAVSARPGGDPYMGDLIHQAQYMKNNPSLFSGQNGAYSGPGTPAGEAILSGSGAPVGTQNFSGVMGGIVDQTTNNPLIQNMMSYLQEQGTRAYQNSAAAKGMLNSGRALEELQKQGQGLAATNVMPMVNSLMQQVVSGVSGIQQAYLGSTMSGAAGLAGNALSAVQQGLSNLVQQGNVAAQAGASLQGEQGKAGAGIKMDVGKYQADARMLQGKVTSDALNAMAQIQFAADMGPYATTLSPTPQAQGFTSAPFLGAGGSGASTYFGGQ